MNINYVVTLCFLLLSSRANFLSYNDPTWFILLLFIVWAGIEKKRILLSHLKVFGWFFGVYLTFILSRNFLVNHLGVEFLVSDFIYAFKYIFLSFIFCAILKEEVLKYLVKVITHLTIISLCFYVIQAMGLGIYIYKFSKTLNLPPRPGIDGYTNFIIFTYTLGRHDFRNSGFVWEPGAFGCFLVLALMFNLFINKFKFDRTSKILIVGIITTLSTTNYLALFILLFLAYRYRVPKINIGVVLLIPISIILITTIPFLGDKISETYVEDMQGLDDIQQLSGYYTLRDEQIPLNRFASMTFVINSFGHKLWLGVSNKYDAVLNQIYNVNVSNGIADMLAKFGVVGLLYLFYCYSKYCLYYVVKTEFLIYCILILLVLSFGETILFIPYILMFMFLPFCNIDVGEENSEDDSKLIGSA